MAMHMSTAGIEAGVRVDYWRESLKTMFRAECRVEPRHGAPFQAGMSADDFGAASLVDIHGSAFDVSRRGIADDSRAFVLLQLEGDCVVRQEGREAQLGPGDLCVLPVVEEMEIERRADFRQISLSLPVERLSELSPSWKRLAATTLPGDSCCARILAATAKSMVAVAAELESAARSGLGDAMICMLGVTLNGFSGEEALPQPPRDVPPSRLESFHLERIKRFIRDHLGHPELDAAFIAAGVGLSPRYVHRLFEKEPLRLMQWVWEQRLANCHRELLRRRTSGRSISQIAYAWGYNDQAHFSRSFRKRYGVSPRDL